MLLKRFFKRFNFFTFAFKGFFLNIPHAYWRYNFREIFPKLTATFRKFVIALQRCYNEPILNLEQLTFALNRRRFVLTLFASIKSKHVFRAQNKRRTLCTARMSLDVARCWQIIQPWSLQEWLICQKRKKLFEPKKVEYVFNFCRHCPKQTFFNRVPLFFLFLLQSVNVNFLAYVENDSF